MTRPRSARLRHVHWPKAVEVATNRRGQRRPIVRDYLFRTTARLTPSFAIESDGMRFYLSTADREVSRILFIYGFYDKLLLESVFRILSALGGRPFELRDRLFLDIGANIGSATVEATVRFGASGAYCFEPDAENFRYLQVNLAANDLLDRVSAHRLALSDREGEVPFERSPDNSGDHRVRRSDPREDLLGERSRQVGAVPATTLDALVADGVVDLERVGLAWIDVQAHEPQVLAGARSLTESSVPVVIEYWPYALRSAGNLELMDELIAGSYSHFVDTKGGREHADATLRPTSTLKELHAAYAGPGEPTDLVLVKR